MTLLILKISGDSDETDESGDTVESSDPGKYDKSCYPSEYGDSHDSLETYNFGQPDYCDDSDEPGESVDFDK